MGEEFRFEYLIPEELSAPETYDLCETAEEAFSKDGKPSFKDTMSHLVDADRVLVLRADEEPIGFSSARINPCTGISTDHVVHHAAAVQPRYQGEGLSRLLSDLSTMVDMGSDYVVAGRTTHPAFVKYYGMDEKSTDEEAKNFIEAISGLWPGELEDGYVLKQSFQEQLYSEEEFESFAEEFSDILSMDYEPENGDAFVVYEKTNASEKFGSALATASNLKSPLSEQIYEQVKKKYLGMGVSQRLEEFYDVFIGELEGEPMSPASNGELEAVLSQQLSQASGFVDNPETKLPENYDPSRRVLSIGPGTSSLTKNMAQKFPDLKFKAVEPSKEMAKFQKNLLSDINNAKVIETGLNDYLNTKDSDYTFAGAFGINSVQETMDPSKTLRRVNEMLQLGGRGVYTYPGPGTKKPVVNGEIADSLSLDLSAHPKVETGKLHPWNSVLDQKILTREDEKSAFEGVEVVHTDNIETSKGRKVAELVEANGLEGFKQPDNTEGGVRLAVVANLLER